MEATPFDHDLLSVEFDALYVQVVCLSLLYLSFSSVPAYISAYITLSA